MSLMNTKKINLSKAASAALQQADSLLNARRLPEAITAYEAILQAGSKHPNLYCNMAMAYDALGEKEKAEQAYRDGLELDNKHLFILNNFGFFLAKSGHYTEAERLLRRAVSIKPDYRPAHSNLAIVLSQTSRMTEAVASYRKAAKLEPFAPATAANILFNMNYLPETTPEQIFTQAKIVGRNWTRQIKPMTAWPAFSTVSTRPEKLKIGFLSSDLMQHPVGFFLADVLHAFRKDIYEWHAFSTRDSNDPIATRLRSDVHHWHSLSSKNDEQAAGLIRDLGIHILIDLSGHASGNRMGIMAYKPAPIQASWLGWFCTTGLPTIDYLITDRCTTPVGSESYFTEQLYFLPDTRLCLSQPVIDESVAASPCLSNGHITFGCMQNAVKITDENLTSWASILNAVPNAKLVLQSQQFSSDFLREVFINRATNAGLDTARLTLQPFSTWLNYMRQYAQIDILLDTFPYPGGTTTAEALYMGVPTLTRTGQTMIARQGASLMTAAGLPDWVCADKSDYIERAIAWSSRFSELSTLRAGLREQVTNSPLFQSTLFARHFEQALESFWGTLIQNAK
jgi:predicted O-linked N-acetylglucosamine transferase (SPINDLY family)